MPLTLSCGFSKKVGQPNYGSLGASCSLELELDSGLLTHEPEAFRQQVEAAYLACREAVETELARPRATIDGLAAHARNEGNGHEGNGHDDGETPANNAASLPATDRQIDFARQLAIQIPAMGIRRLETVSQYLCGKPLAALTSVDASKIIDTLKAVRAGRIPFEKLSEGAIP